MIADELMATVMGLKRVVRRRLQASQPGPRLRGAHTELLRVVRLSPGIGVAVMPTSLVPEDLKIITRRFDLPAVGDVDFTLIRNPLANAEVIDALTQSIVGRTINRQT